MDFKEMKTVMLLMQPEENGWLAVHKKYKHYYGRMTCTEGENGIEVEAIKEGDGIIESLEERIVGRVLAEDIVDPATGEKIASLNDTVDEALAKKIAAVREKVSIRSVLTCKSQFGVCIKCYGRDLANQAEVEVGEAVGVIAAQSIGEPGTQLTMRTFHSGGVAGDDITQGLPRVEELFEARKPKHHAIIAEIGGTAEVEDTGKGMRKVTIHPFFWNELF